MTKITPFRAAAALTLAIGLGGAGIAIAQSASEGKPLPMDVRFLAGLQKIEYVMAAPESGDIILAGPAEPLTVNERGEVVGAESGNPALRLEPLDTLEPVHEVTYPPTDTVAGKAVLHHRVPLNLLLLRHRKSLLHGGNDLLLVVRINDNGLSKLFRRSGHLT